MKAIIKGRNYNFCVVAKRVQFYIEAIHLVSSKHSFINNLNTVLSEFNISMDDKKVSDSQWITSKRQGKLFFEKAIEFLLNKVHRDYVEKRLDEDRQYGEWENIKENKS